MKTTSRGERTMSAQWDGKVVMSTPGGPVIEMSLGDYLARKDAEIERLRADNERMRDALRWYADRRNHSPVKRRSPGDPDPAVIFVEGPPIMIDGGTRARETLENER